MVRNRREERRGVESAALSHVIVASHERSGTHVAIDAVRNNFSPYKKLYYTNIDRMLDGHWSQCSPAEIENELDEGPRVIKTHMTSDAGQFFGQGEAADLVERLVGGEKVIYVYRDGRDVLGSLYTFWSRTDADFRGTTFSDMLRGSGAGEIDHVGGARGKRDLVSYWRDHVEGWLERSGILALSYEEFIQNYDNTVRCIGDYLGLDSSEPIKRVLRSGGGSGCGRVRDAMAKFYNRWIKGVEITSVTFNKGGTGGHKASYSKEDQTFLHQKAGELRRRLGYTD